VVAIPGLQQQFLSPDIIRNTIMRKSIIVVDQTKQDVVRKYVFAAFLLLIVLHLLSGLPGFTNVTIGYDLPGLQNKIDPL
jgi:hypothetical protein